jgi:hypothetical protein
MCGGVARLRFYTAIPGTLGSYVAVPACTVCGSEHRVPTQVALTSDGWLSMPERLRDAVASSAWLGWDSAWWTKAREPVVDSVLSGRIECNTSAMTEALKTLGLIDCAGYQAGPEVEGNR